MFQELGRPPDTPQGIFNFVGQIADQLPAGLLLLDQLLFPGRPDLLVNGAQFQEQLGTGHLQGGHGAIQLQHLLVRTAHLNVVAGVAPVVGNRVIQGFLQPPRIGNELLQGVKDQVLGVGRQQVLRRRIDVADHLIRIQDNGGGGQ